MLIPSIDLQDGRIVQLVQGERLAIASADIDQWVDRFTGYLKVQVIDLDAAKGAGENSELVGEICQRLPCQVGGGIRTIERAEAVLRLGAHRVILGSALFSNDRVDLQFASEICAAVGAEQLIAAVDSRGGRVVVHGWRTQLPLTSVDAIRALEPFVGEFLYTNVDREGLMEGPDFEAIRTVRAATSRRVTAAGGITTLGEIEYLETIDVDAVVGMAIYTGRLKLPSA